ncbi:hypothetical protein DV711_03545 [Motiliproteus coralliicola]|uniref:Uncharacterized protein n=1 Tax=Motiliproteus coralliicola TaxID=2283196 RepID=A0A369WVV7_9GAMM|nr:hypothetical protein [Motiliproteus coralliicola]RDE24676.1 hypothetical protein DV711_03545 [Motiliproteus coralliicola]
MSFDKLLDLNLTHDYYQGPCPDLQIEPSADTLQLLKAASIKTYTKPGGLSLYYPQDDQGLPKHSLAGQRLLLSVTTVNPAFSALTELPLADDRLPLYRNHIDPLSLAPAQSTHRVPGRFAYPVQLNERPLTLALNDDQGNLIEQHSISTAQQTTHSLLLQQYGAGFYRITETSTSGSHEMRLIYLPRIPHNLIALVELIIQPAFYGNPPTFNIHYSARNDTLNYYVVAQNYSDTEFDHLQLADAGFAEQSRAEINFTRVESSNFTQAHTDAALLHDGGSKVVLFHSQTVVSRRQHGPKKLQLRLGGEVLIASLPTPGRNSITADFFINVAKA